METFTPYVNTVLPIILTGIIAYISWLYKSEREKRITIQSQLSDCNTPLILGQRFS